MPRVYFFQRKCPRCACLYDTRLRLPTRRLMHTVTTITAPPARCGEVLAPSSALSPAFDSALRQRRAAFSPTQPRYELPSRTISPRRRFYAEAVILAFLDRAIAGRYFRRVCRADIAIRRPHARLHRDDVFACCHRRRGAVARLPVAQQQRCWRNVLW